MRGCWVACAQAKVQPLACGGSCIQRQHTEADRPALATLLCRCKEDVANAETALQDILKDLRRQLRLPSLDYKTVQNQGEYLIEVPTERTDVPKVRCRAGSSHSAAPAQASSAWLSNMGNMQQ